MASVLLPKAQWITNARNGGGTYAAGFDWRIVLHTIEGSASPAMIAGHAYPPHVWYDPQSRQLWQTVPLDRFAFALEHPAGTIETNAARALQVEISGQAQNTPDWPQAWLDNLAEDVIVPMCQWVASIGGSIDLLDVPAPGAIPGSASEAAPQRFTETAWQAFRGICGHRHVPNNIHWDPGALDTNHIAAHAALTVGGLLAAASTTEDHDMAKLICTPDGTVWSTDGVTAARLQPLTLRMLKRVGLVPAAPEWGEPVSWDEAADLLIPYKTSLVSMRDAMTLMAAERK